MPPTSSIYFIFLPHEMQRRLKQTIVNHAISYFISYLSYFRNDPRTAKVAAAKTKRVYVIGTTCFDECFVFYVITGRHYFSWKFIVTLRFFKCHVAAFYERSPYFMRYPHNNTTMLILKFRNKAGYTSWFS